METRQAAVPQAQLFDDAVGCSQAYDQHQIAVLLLKHKGEKNVEL